MTNIVQAVPNPSLAGLSGLVSFIYKSLVAPPKSTTKPHYCDDGQVQYVSVNPIEGYPLGECWYNCIEHFLANGGQVVYGWLLWELSDGASVWYIAQHHAVWRDINDKLMDLTPNAIGAEVVMFMPDNRAPLNFDNLVAPASLEWVDDTNFTWLGCLDSKKEFHTLRLSMPGEKLENRIQRLRLELASR